MSRNFVQYFLYALHRSQYHNITSLVGFLVILFLVQITCGQINLFINSDAILNSDALWSIQGKKHYLQAAIVGGIHHTEKILR